MGSERAAARWRGLYAITPDCADTRSLAQRVEQAIDGGAAMVQYRAKSASPALSLLQARTLAELCRARGVPLIVNDSLELALAARADGVHLGRDDAGVREARIAFPEAIIGISCYDDPRRVEAAARAGADYVAVGSMFASTTKPGAVRAPLALLGQARRIASLPVVAIGGITRENAHLAIEAGADLVAVIAAVFDAPDVRAAAGAIVRLFDDVAIGADDVRAQPRAV